ncbi:MAG: hypothetical protein ACLSWA_05975 [Thomasclavelia spiroformis]
MKGKEIYEKKKRLLPIVMASLIAMSINVGPLKAADAPLITNPSFEHEIDKNEVQLYKAVRTDEKAFDGKYSIKVGNPKPENPSEVPIWRYNYGKVVLMLFSITLSLTLHTRLLPITGMNPE